MSTNSPIYSHPAQGQCRAGLRGKATGKGENEPRGSARRDGRKELNKKANEMKVQYQQSGERKPAVGRTEGFMVCMQAKFRSDRLGLVLAWLLLRREVGDWSRLKSRIMLT